MIRRAALLAGVFTLLAPLPLHALDCNGRSGILGDVTGDGDINVVDAQRTARFSAGLSVPDPERVEAFGDVTRTTQSTSSTPSRSPGTRPACPPGRRSASPATRRPCT